MIKIMDEAKRLPLFTAGNRQKLKEGDKWQTRRVIKLFDHPDKWELIDLSKDPLLEDVESGKISVYHGFVATFEHCNLGEYYQNFKAAGSPGELAYLTEPLHRDPLGQARYQDDDELAISRDDQLPIIWRWQRDQLSSMFMPAEAARSFYRYTEIKVERLHEIKDPDCIAEGVINRSQYARLWDEINAARGYPWSRNDFVFVYDLEPIGADHE